MFRRLLGIALDVARHQRVVAAGERPGERADFGIVNAFDLRIVVPATATR